MSMKSFVDRSVLVLILVDSSLVSILEISERSTARSDSDMTVRAVETIDFIMFGDFQPSSRRTNDLTSTSSVHSSTTMKFPLANSARAERTCWAVWSAAQFAHLLMRSGIVPTHDRSC